MSRKKRLVLGMTGATGAVYGLRILQVLKEKADWETHLVVSSAGLVNLKHELAMSRTDLYRFADVTYNNNDVAAAIASGSFKTEGMIVAPCSMKTLAAIAHGFGDNLIARATDVALKERRRVIIVPRETPLNLAHIKNMAAATEMGAIVYPPMPAFYAKPNTLEAMVDDAVGRILDLFGIETEGLYTPWEGV
ncbi:MAG: UbiX family flavin prenyltransferase [Gammaproteobacteria bacterium]